MADAKFLTIPHLDRRTLRRIFSKIVTDPDTSCWLWSGEGMASGYGKTNIGGRKGFQVLMHRLMFAWLVGPVPMGRSGPDRLVVHHVCEVKRCCNPAHLQLISHDLNTDVPGAFGFHNRRKTVCPKGHPLPKRPNKFINGRAPSRACVTCGRTRARKRAALMRYALERLKASGFVPPREWREFFDEP